MATLTVSATTNFSGQALNNITTIDFTNGVATTATATFANTQFNNVAILDNVLIDGSFGVNRIVINGGSVDASAWTFANWFASDTITINGAGSAQNTLHGSSLKDTINGGGFEDDIFGEGGADILNGGASDDAFRFTAGTQVVAGLQIDGGTQTDKIALNSGSGFDFSLATIVNVERLDFFSGTQTATFDASQVGAGKINTFVATVGGPATINIVGAANLSLATASVSFGAGDSFNITGAAAADLITGSSANDTIEGGDGADTLNGGGGNDQFVLNSAAHFDAGETINGGSGLGDTLLLNTGFIGINFSASNLIGIEKLAFGASGGFGNFVDTHFGTAANRINAVTGSALGDRFDITGTAIDLTGVAFTAWTNGQDKIFLTGTAGTDTITGSSEDDTITPGLGVDTLGGGGGNDVFVYTSNGAPGDTVDGGAGTGDALRLQQNGEFHLFGIANFVGVEKLIFAGGAQNLIIDGSQLASALNELVGDASINQLTVNANTNANLAGLTFTDWTNGVDLIAINGANFADILTGSSEADTITGNAGADQLRGGGGNDTIFFDAADTVVNGGIGFDIARFQGVTSGLRNFNFAATEIEEVHWTLNSNDYKLTSLAGGAKLEFVEDTAATEAFFRLSTTLDSQLRVELEDKVLDSQTTRILSDFDAGNIATFSLIVQTFIGANVNNLNTLDVDDRRFDNGTRVVTDFDALNNQPFISVATSFTAGGLVDFQDSQNDNGTRFIFDSDQDNLFAFNTVQSTFAPGNILDVQDTLNDDGRRVVFDKDVANTFTFDTVTTTFVPGGAVDFQDTRFDDGRRVIFDSDQGNAFAFTSVTTSFDSAGARDVEDTIFDAGHRVVFDYDNLNTQNFQEFKTVFNAAGAVDFTDVLFDTNFRTVIDLDDLSNQPWLSVKNEFNAVNFLFRQTITLDDGTVQVFNF